LFSGPSCVFVFCASRRHICVLPVRSDLAGGTSGGQTSQIRAQNVPGRHLSRRTPLLKSAKYRVLLGSVSRGRPTQCIYTLCAQHWGFVCPTLGICVPNTGDLCAQAAIPLAPGSHSSCTQWPFERPFERPFELPFELPVNCPSIARNWPQIARNSPVIRRKSPVIHRKLPLNGP